MIDLPTESKSKFKALRRVILIKPTPPEEDEEPLPIDPLYHEPIELCKVRRRSNSIPEINFKYFPDMEFEFDIESLGKPLEPKVKKPVFKITEKRKEMTKDEYIQDLRLLLLRRRFDKHDEMNTDQDDMMLENHEMFYGLRLIKSQKKYAQYKNFKEKQKTLNEQKENEQSELITEFFEDFNEKIQMKNRISEKDNKTIKKKYHRQPKIYQNNYILELQNKRKIKENITVPDDINPEFNILYLFFEEKSEHFLLLGREEREEEKDDVSPSVSGSKQSNEEQEEAAIIDSDRESKEEEDDDSPYFVKITLDSWFLSHLDEPDLVEATEIDGQYELLMQNKAFNEIIRREIDMMFGVEKPKKVVAQPEIPEQIEPRDSLSQSSQSLSESMKGDEAQRTQPEGERQATQASFHLDLGSGNEGQQNTKAKADAAKDDRAKGQEEKKVPNHAKQTASKDVAGDKSSKTDQGLDPSLYLSPGGLDKLDKNTLLEVKMRGMINNFSQILNFK